MAGKDNKPKGGKGKDKGKDKSKDKGKSPKKGTKKEETAVDLFSPAAMLNVYYICHNAAAFLQCRGYPWPGSPKKKGGGKKKKKK